VLIRLASPVSRFAPVFLPAAVSRIQPDQHRLLLLMIPPARPTLAKVPLADLSFGAVSSIVDAAKRFGILGSKMTRRVTDASPDANSWKDPLGTGLLAIIFATAWLWGACREFRPPPEEPKSVEATLQEAAESSRETGRFLELMRERSQITDAIERRIKELEAPPTAGDDHAARDDEKRGLRRKLLAEMQKTSQLLSAQQAAIEERKRAADAPRQAQVARAAEQWRRYRPVFLATGVSFLAWAGWLLWRAHRLHSEQYLAERAGGAERRRSGSHRAEAGDPQWNQRLVVYLVQLAVFIGFILFGLSGSVPPAGADNEREEFLFLGLFGLATSTVFLFFGSIDWSTWNAIKDAVRSRNSAADGKQSPDSAPGGRNGDRP